MASGAGLCKLAGGAGSSRTGRYGHGRRQLADEAHATDDEPALGCVIVAQTRGGGARLAEWVFYHQSLGIERIFLYCADADPRAAFFQVAAFCAAGFVRFIHHPEAEPADTSLAAFAQEYGGGSGWVMALATNEFLSLAETGAGTRQVAAFLRTIPPHWDCIAFNLLLFGGLLTSSAQALPLLAHSERCAAELSPVCRRMTRAARLTPGAALTRAEASGWLDWERALGGEVQSFDLNGRLARQYGWRFPSEAIEYLADPMVRRRILARGVVCHVLLPDAARPAADTERLARLATAAEYTPLRDHAARLLAAHMRPAAPAAARAENLALRRPATQSSRCLWSHGGTLEADAAGAVNGRLTGSHQFHTHEEDEPWWQVDLGDPVELSELRVYNRLDTGEERALPLSFLASLDGGSWSEFYRRPQDEPFGGADGKPLVWTAGEQVCLRYLRLVVRRFSALHLDQVEVFGRRRHADAFFL